MTADSMDSISHPAAEHVIATTRRDHFSQAGDIALALAVIEDVEEPAVEHGVELLTQINEAKGICDDEARLHAPFGRLRLGQLDGPHRHVDPPPLRSRVRPL